MAIYDISLPISESLVVWPDDPGIQLTHASHLDRGDPCTVTHLSLGAHTGTHVDAPAHFISGGPGIERLDLEVLVGPALVVHALEVDALSADVLEGLNIPPGTERLLFRTRNSACWARGDADFDESFVAITEDGARWLVERGVRLVGIDYLSVGPFRDTIGTHQVLLGAGVIALEGLDLGRIVPGVYQLYCLPLKIVGCDGAPARAILTERRP